MKQSISITASKRSAWSVRSNAARARRSPRTRRAPGATAPRRPRLTQVTAWPWASSTRTILVLICPVPPMTPTCIAWHLLRLTVAQAVLRCSTGFLTRSDTKVSSSTALVGCQGRRCTESVQPDFCCSPSLEARIFQWPYTCVTLLRQRGSLRPRHPRRACNGWAGIGELGSGRRFGLIGGLRPRQGPADQAGPWHALAPHTAAPRDPGRIAAQTPAGETAR